MTKVPLLRLRYAAAFMDAAVTQGADAEALLAGVGLTPAALETPEAWMALSEFFVLIEEATRMTGRRTLGLEAGIARRRSHSEFSKRTLYVPTLHQALSKICAGASEEDTSARFRVRIDGQNAWLRCGSVDASPEATRQMETYRYAALVAVVRCAAGPDWLPDSAHFCSGPDEKISASTLLKGVNARFNCSEMAFCIAPTLLGRPMINVPDVPVTTSEFSKRPIEYVESLREVVRTELLAGVSSVDTIANKAGVSTRTMQRSLAEFGITYSHILENVKVELAKSWLEADKKPIRQIANDLGYKYSTHFTRAFRKVCGVSPRTYRQSHRTDNLRPPAD